jgi:hypothetical protein
MGQMHDQPGKHRDDDAKAEHVDQHDAQHEAERGAMRHAMVPARCPCRRLQAQRLASAASHSSSSWAMIVATGSSR